MTELWQLGALDIASAIRKGETREVFDALLSRIEAVNGELNAVVASIGDEAVAAVQALEDIVGVITPIEAMVV